MLVDKEKNITKVILQFMFIMLSMLLMGTVGCCYPVRYDGPYKGRVVDAETGKPLEGVVVLGEWHKKHATAGGTVSTYYDAKETVTAGNGEFEIRGMGLKILSNVGSMSVVIFKSGYQYIDGPWESHKYEGGLMKDKAKVEDDRVILPIRKLTVEETKKRMITRPPGVPDEKMTMLTKEINRERVAEGLSPL